MSDGYELATAKTFQDFATPFDVPKAAIQDVQYAIDPRFGLTRARYGWFSNGELFDSTLFNEPKGEIQIETRGEADDTAKLRPAFSGQYVAQSLAQPGVEVSIDESNLELDTDGRISLSHGLVQFGPFWRRDGEIVDGFGIEIDADGARAFRKAGGEHRGDSPVPQPDWNIDPWDGSGPSGRTFTPEQGFVINYPYTWYNSNRLSIGFVDKGGKPTSPEGIQLVHTFQPEESPSTETANFPNTVYVSNDGVAESLTVSMGGTQFATYGADGVPQTRPTPAWRNTSGDYITTAVTDTPDPYANPGEPLLSARRESGAYDLEFQTESVAAVSAASLRLYLWDSFDAEADLTGANFSPPSSIDNPAESKLETDREATAFTPTNAILRDFEDIEGGDSGGGPSQRAVADVQFENRHPIDATSVITAVITDDSNSTDADTAVRYLEGY